MLNFYLLLVRVKSFDLAHIAYAISRGCFALCITPILLFNFFLQHRYLYCSK